MSIESMQQAMMEENATAKRSDSFRVNMADAYDYNPDDEAEKRRLQKQTGVPALLMDEEIKAQAKRQSYLEKLAVVEGEAPATATFLSRPENARVAHDDLDRLSDLEQVIRYGFGNQRGPVSTLGIATPKDAAYAARQRQELKTTLKVLADPEQRGDYFTGVKERMKGATLRGVGGLSIMIGENMAQPLRDMMGYEEESGFLTGGRALLQKGRAITEQAAQEHPVEPHSWLAAGASALESIGQQVPLWLGAVLTKNPSAVVTGIAGMSAGQEYADLRERGIAPQNAAVGAAGVGAVEAATEAWPTRALWDMMKPAARGSFVKLGNKMVELYGAEIVGESAATFFQDVIDKVYTKPDMTPAEIGQALTDYVGSGEAWVNFIDTVKSTAIQTTVMGGAGAGINRAGGAVQNRMERAKAAKENAAVLNALGGIVKDSKTWQRLPDKLKEAVQTHVDEHGAIEQVSIPVEYWQSGLESQGLDPAKVADDVLSDPAAYYEALETGGEVVIPLADYVVKVAPAEFHQALANDVRFSPGEMTVREAEDFEKGADRDAILQELNATAQEDGGVPAVDPLAESTRKVYEDVFGQLSGMFPRDTAQKYATLAAARARTRAERLERDVWDLYQESPIKIRRPMPEFMTRRDFVDTSIDPFLDRLRAGDIPTERDAFGDSLVDFLRMRGIQDAGGELAALGVDEGLRPFERKMVQEGGLPLDRAREAAVEAGYLPEGSDIRALLDSIDAERRGAAVYSTVPQNEEAANLRLDMEQLRQYLESVGVDVDTMTNEEIRRALKGAEYNQGPVLPDFIDVDGFQQPARNSEGVPIADTEEGIRKFWRWFGNSRAVDALGRPQVLYHQTSKTSAEGIRAEGFDTSKVGARGSDEEMPDGIFLKPNNSDIGLNRKDSDVEQLPLYAKIENPLNFKNRAGLAGFLSQAEGYDEAARETRRIDKEVAEEYDRMDAVAQANDSFNDEFFEWADLHFEEGRKRIDAAAAKARAIATEYLKEEGVDGVVIAEDAGSFGRKVNTFVVFDPTQVKSATENRGTWDGNDPRILYQDDRTYAEGKRGSITFGPGFRNIALMEKADLSTFLHELGHSWLEELKVDAARDGVPNQVKDDWETIKAWLGVEGDTITVEQHEQFARGAEAYLMEGKAPSTELQQIFHRFAAWLKMIYRELRGLNVRLNDDVRKVFDRLIASDGEIELARKQQRLQPMFMTATEMGISEAEFKLYADQAAKAGQAARDSLFNTVLEELRREQRKEWRERLKETRDEVEAEAKEVPVYRAWQVLTRGEDFDGSKPEVPLKLSREILVEIYGEDFVKQLPRGFQRIYSAEGGFHPDDLAQIFGFQTGRQMLDALTGMQRMKDFVKAEVDRRMHERYPDLFDDGRIVEEAIAAAMSEDMGKVMHIEAQAIARQLEKTDKAIRARESESRRQKREAFGKVPPLEFFRLNALLAIGRMPATRIDPRFYSRASAKAGLEVEKALSKQDWETAAAAQTRRLTNLYLFREATKARQEVEKIGKHMRGLAAPAAQKRLGLGGEGFQEQINDILARFEFAVVPFKELQRRDDLVAWAEKVNRESGMEPYIVRDLPESVTNYRQIPLEDLRALYEMARSIEHVARSTKQALQQLDKETMEEIRGELMEAADVAGKDLKRQVSEDLKTFWDNRRGEAERWDAENVTARTIINILDGGRQDGPWHRYLLHPASTALTEQLDLGEKVAARMNDMLDSLDGSRLRDPIGTKYGVLSRREVMSLALNLGNLSNIDKMVRGGFAAWQGKTGEVTPWQFEDVFEICQRLDRQDWQFIQEVWSLLDQELAPMVDRLQRQFTGLPLKKVEAQTINIRTADGHEMSLKGGYYPMVYDPRFANAHARSSDGYLAGLGDDFSRVTTPQGSTIERTGYAAPVLMDFTRVLSKHLHDNILDVTHRAFLYDTQRLLNHPEIRNILQTKLGGAYEKVLNDWLKIIAGDGSVDPARNMHFLDKMAEKARTNVTIVALGFKVTTMLAQPTAVFNAMEHPDVGASGFLRGFKELSLEPGYIFGMGKTWEMITEKSSFMRHRSGAVDATIRDSLKRLDTQAMRWKAVLAHASMVGVGWADRGTTAPTWLGAYRGALAKGLSEEHAIQAADNAVVETHGSGNPMDLNVRQARRGVSKLFTMFMTPFVAAYQRIRQRGRDVNQKGVHYLPHAVLATLMVTALPAVIGDLITGRGPKECEPGDVKCYAKWALAKMLIAPAAITPESRIVGNFLEAKFVDGNKGADLRYSAVFSALDKMAKTASRDMDALFDDRDFDKKLLLDNLEAGAYLSGIPIGQGIITGSYLYDLMEGEERPESPGELMRNLMFRRVK